MKTAIAGLTGSAVVYVAAFGGVIAHYAAAARGKGAPLSLRAFNDHVLPRALLVSPWTRLDIAFYVVDKFMFLLIFPSVAAMAVMMAAVTRSALEGMTGTAPAIPVTFFSLSVFLVCGLLVRDFVSFYVHYTQHRVPLLWEFHKVHHAPESLIPLTGHRLHPVDSILGMIAEAVPAGIIVGFFAWLTHQESTRVILYTVSFHTLVNLITFAPLRHSHIDLRLGKLEYFLLSPAHHQLHHGFEGRYLDKNFAAIFPFWDRLFRTLRAPPPFGSYQLGLAKGESRHYATLLACYLIPFQRIAAASGMSTVTKCQKSVSTSTTHDRAYNARTQIDHSRGK